MFRSRQEVSRQVRVVRKKVGDKVLEYYVAYIGRDPISGRRVEISRKSTKALMAEVDRYFAAMRKGVAPADTRDALDPQEVAELKGARETLGSKEPFAVLRAAESVRDARRLLDESGHEKMSVLDAVRAFCESKSGIRETTLGEAYDAYMATFNEDQETYKNVLRQRVGRMVLELGADRFVSDVKPVEAMEWITRSFGDKSEKTFNNYLGDCRTFFNWCAKPVRAFCKENPLASAEMRRIAKKRPEFMSADETQKWFDILLNGACDAKGRALLWWNALGFFAGARTAEIHRLTWKDVDLDAGTVLFAEPKGFAHGIPPRYVKLNDAALAWMRAAPLVRGAPDSRVFPGVDETRSVSNTLERIARKNGIVVPRNAARHTFITMHVAAFHDAALTESIVGTSATMRRSHYQGLVKEEEAKRYFETVRP